MTIDKKALQVMLKHYITKTQSEFELKLSLIKEQLERLETSLDIISDDIKGQFQQINERNQRVEFISAAIQSNLNNIEDSFSAEINYNLKKMIREIIRCTECSISRDPNHKTVSVTLSYDEIIDPNHTNSFCTPKRHKVLLNENCDDEFHKLAKEPRDYSANELQKSIKTSDFEKEVQAPIKKTK